MATSRNIGVLLKIKEHRLRLRNLADTRRMNALCNMKAGEVKAAYPEFARYTKTEAIFKILVREGRVREVKVGE